MSKNIRFNLVNFISDLFYNSKLKYKLIIVYSLLTLVFLAFTGMMFRYFFIKYIYESEETALNRDMKQLNNNIDYFFELYMNKSDMLFGNVELQNLLTKKNSDMQDVVNTYARLDELIGQFLSDFRYPFMKGTYFFGGMLKASFYLTNDTIIPNGEEISDYKQIKNESWVKAFAESKELFYWRSNVVFMKTQNIVMNRRLIDFKTSQLIGILSIYIPVDRIRNIIETNMKGSAYGIFYIDNENNIILSNGDILLNEPANINAIKALALEEGLRNITIGGKQYITGSITSDLTLWKLVYVAPLSNITDKAGFVSTITFSILSGAIIVCILISILIASFLTKRIKILVEKTKCITENNMNTAGIIIKGEDEIGQLDRNFDNMIKRINDLIEIEYKAQIIMNKTRFELLQEQINPHMLYNTLSMIGYTARKAKQYETVGVVNSLIGFYRSILNEGRIISTFRAEIDMIDRYIEIARFVYKLDIEVVYETEDEILDYYSIKLLLQPIVENSIIHGIKPVKVGTIVISGESAEDSIRFSVLDNGIGMEYNELRYLNSLGSAEKNTRSYGLGNVLKRIKLFFGDNYGLDFVSNPKEGTLVTVTVPKLTEEQIKSIIGKV